MELGKEGQTTIIVVVGELKASCTITVKVTKIEGWHKDDNGKWYYFNNSGVWME